MSYAFQIIDRTGYLHYVAAGYLLNEWGIRCSAPLSATNTLRFHPTVHTTADDIRHIEAALRSLCKIMRFEDTYKLVEFMLPDKEKGLRKSPVDFRSPDILQADCPEGVMKVGFVTHFIGTKTICEADPSLAGVSDETLDDLFDEFLPISAPFMIGSRLIHGAQGEPVHLTLVGLPVTSQMCRRAIVRNQALPFVKMCRQAIDILADSGAKVIGLGQFSSIFMKNGYASTRPDVCVTTGNTFTARLGLDAIEAALFDRQRDPSQEMLGVIGAAGNIASVYAQYASRWAKGIILLGSSEATGRGKTERTAAAIIIEAAQQVRQRGARPGHRLEEWMSQSPVFQEFESKGLSFHENGFYNEIRAAHPDDVPVTVAESLADLHCCGVIVSATSAPEPFLRPEHFQSGTIICDISVPLNCTPELLNNKKDIKVISGGLAVLPNGEAMPMRAFPLPDGQVFGCLAETLLLGMAQRAESFSFGRIYCDKVDEIGELSKRFGFALFDKKTSWY
jgi:predicted amino acid dehydrogenase